MEDTAQLSFELTGLTMYIPCEAWIEPYDGILHFLGESNRAPLMASDILQHIPLISAR